MHTKCPSVSKAVPLHTIWNRNLYTSQCGFNFWISQHKINFWNCYFTTLIPPWYTDCRTDVFLSSNCVYLEFGLGTDQQTEQFSDFCSQIWHPKNTRNLQIHPSCPVTCAFIWQGLYLLKKCGFMLFQQAGSFSEPSMSAPINTVKCFFAVLPTKEHWRLILEHIKKQIKLICIKNISFFISGNDWGK